MYKVYFSSSFDRKVKKVFKKHSKLKLIVDRRVKKLAKNPRDPALRLHKLSGRNNWSIFITRDIRIIFGFRGKKIYLLEIGSHDEVY